MGREMFTQICVNDICWWRENCFGETRRVESELNQYTSRKLWYQQLETGDLWFVETHEVLFKVKVSGVYAIFLIHDVFYGYKMDSCCWSQTNNCSDPKKHWLALRMKWTSLIWESPFTWCTIGDLFPQLRNNQVKCFVCARNSFSSHPHMGRIHKGKKTFISPKNLPRSWVYESVWDISTATTVGCLGTPKVMQLIGMFSEEFVGIPYLEDDPRTWIHGDRITPIYKPSFGRGPTGLTNHGFQPLASPGMILQVEN